MLFLLVLLLPGITRADRFCVQNSTDLCLGFSGYASQLPVLQLKSWYDLITNDDEKRINFSLKERLEYNGLVVDNVGRGYAGLANVTKARGVVWNGTQLLLNGTTKCLTVMQCNSGVQDFCHPNTVKATRMYQIQKGSYLGFKPCSTSVSQFFVLNPDCAPGCTAELLQTPTCTVACMSKTCHYNASLCATGRPTKPTWFPTFVAGRPTPRPTFHPTSSPEKVNYTFSPSREPTFQPTTEPTQQPTTQPTSQPTSQPTREPTFQPTGEPTSQPTQSPSPGEQMAPSPPPRTQSPTLPPQGLTWQEKVGLGVGIGLLILILLLGLVLFLYWRRQKKPPRSPQIRLNPPTSNSQAVV